MLAIPTWPGSSKEFSIRAVDGSRLTTEAFQALNLDADEMARRFIAGGRTSAIAFDEVVDKIRGIKDPVEQSRIAVELFGTQAEDLGGALSKFDLSTAVNEFGEVEGAFKQAADKMVSNSLNEWQTAGRNIQSVINGIRDSLNMDDWFNSIPKAINDWANPNPTSSPPGAPWAPPSPSIVPGPAVTPSTPGGAYTPGQSPLDILAPRTGGPSLSVSTIVALPTARCGLAVLHPVLSTTASTFKISCTASPPPRAWRLRLIFAPATLVNTGVGSLQISPEPLLRCARLPKRGRVTLPWLALRDR